MEVNSMGKLVSQVNSRVPIANIKPLSEGKKAHEDRRDEGMNFNLLASAPFSLSA